MSHVVASPETSTLQPWLHDADAVAVELETDIGVGLSSPEAQRRLARDGPNLLDAATVVPRWRKLLAQFDDPLVYLLLAAVAVSALAWVIEGRHGVPYDVLVIVVIVIANAVLGFAQVARAEQAVAALQRLSASTATVVRDGNEQRIPAADVVMGDVLLLTEGDAVSADARLIEAATLTVAESSLTGESEPVVKDSATLAGPTGIGDRRNMVFDGTAVTRGRGRALVTATGMASEMGHVAHLLDTTATRATPMEIEIARIGRVLGVAIVAIAAVVVASILITSDIDGTGDLVDVLLVGVSLAVAAVPEGLPAIMSVVLGLGVQRLARHHAIVKRLASVETLGSTTVVCSDKTGTLTRNEMTITTIVTATGEVELTGTGYAPDGDLLNDGRALTDETLRREAELVLSAGSLANDASLVEGPTGWSVLGDPTEGAFLVAEAKVGMTDVRVARFTRVGEIPFTSERKMMTTLEADAERTGHIAVVSKGAPDVLLPRCTGERIGELERPLGAERREELLATIDRLADRALRTMAVAYRATEQHQPPAQDSSTEQDLILLGLVGIIDPARPEAAAAVAEAHAAGVRVVMITGDHPRTAARIARDLGIGDDDSAVLSGAELDGLTEEQLRERARTVVVYARVSPEHKLRVVAALQADGNVVAMTGDGVNDAPALKAADIGVAMGTTGTDVTKEAADMVLADDNFATIIVAVRQGRAVVSNVREFLRFLLSSNMGEVLTMFLGVVLAGVIGLDEAGGSIAVPLLATQILWVNLLSDTAPALAMGLDPAPDDIMRRPPRRSGDRIIDSEMWIGVMWVGALTALVTLAALDLGLPGGPLGGSGGIDGARTMAFTTLVLAQMFNAFNARSPHESVFHHLFTNRFLWAAVSVSVVLQVAVVEVGFLNRAFDTEPLSAGRWLTCVALASAVMWAEEVRKLLVRALRRRAVRVGSLVDRGPGRSTLATAPAPAAPSS